MIGGQKEVLLVPEVEAAHDSKNHSNQQLAIATDVTTHESDDTSTSHVPGRIRPGAVIRPWLGLGTGVRR